MARYRIWASVERCEGRRQFVEQEFVVPDYYSTKEITASCEAVVWELLMEELGVKFGSELLPEENDDVQ